MPPYVLVLCPPEYLPAYHEWVSGQGLESNNQWVTHVVNLDGSLYSSTEPDKLIKKLHKLIHRHPPGRPALSDEQLMEEVEGLLQIMEGSLNVKGTNRH